MRNIFLIVSLVLTAAVPGAAQSFSNTLSGSHKHYKANEQPAQRPAETIEEVQQIKHLEQQPQAPSSAAKDVDAVSKANETTDKARPKAAAIINNSYQPISKAGADGVERQVLYTFSPDEELCIGEYFSNFKSRDNKFALITKKGDKYFLTVNGRRAEVASDSPVDVLWIDLNSLDGCIYTAPAKGGEIYFVMEGEKFGPYEEVYFEGLTGASDSKNIEELDYWYKQNSFVFKRNGNYYRHDIDGTCYLLPSPNRLTPMGTSFPLSPVYKSKSGLHVAMLPDVDRPYIVFDDVYYDLTRSVGDGMIYDIYMPDNGVCVVKYVNDGLQLQLLKDGISRRLKDGEYFDPVTSSLKTDYEGEDDHEEGIAERFFRHGDNFLQEMNIDIYDSTGEHHFQSEWYNNFVTVDGKEIVVPAPFNAFYDRDSNSFGWVSLDGYEIVLYSVQL